MRSDPFLLPQCSKRLLAFICSPGDEFVIYAPTEQLQEQFGSHDIGSSFSLSAFSFVCDSAYCFHSGRPRCWDVGMGMWLPLSSSCSACGLGHFPRRGRWVAPQSRHHPSLFSLFTPLLGPILFRGLNHLLPVETLAPESPSYVPKPQGWQWWSGVARGILGRMGPSQDLARGWASSALILLGKFADVSLGIALCLC